MNRYLLLFGLIASLAGCRGILEEPIAVTGTVFSVYTKKSVAGVWVEASTLKGLFNPRSQSLGKALTDANGSFRFLIRAKVVYVYFQIQDSNGGPQGLSWYSARNEPVTLEDLSKGPLPLPVYTPSIFQPTFSNQRPGGKDDQLTVVYSYRMRNFPVNAQEIYVGDSLEFRTRSGFSTDAETYLKFQLRITRGGQTSTRLDSIFIEPGQVNTPRISY